MMHVSEKDMTANSELIAFRLGGQEFCVDIMSVREIRGWTPATPLPRSPGYMKGVINLRGEERRYVFHGVHMMFDGQLEKPWGTRTRQSSLVFIGRNLDRQELEAGLESCVLPAAAK